MLKRNQLSKALAAGMLLAIASIGSAAFIESVAIDNPQITGGSSITRTVTVTVDEATKGSLALAINAGPGLTTSMVRMNVQGKKGYGTFQIRATQLVQQVQVVPVTIRMKRGGDTFTVNVTLKPLVVTSPTWGNTALATGQSYATKLELNSPTLVDRTILVSSTNAGVSVPTEVVIAAGQREAWFTLSVSPSASGSVTVSATFNGATAKRTQAIVALAIQGFDLAPTTTAGGRNATGTVTLNSTVSRDTTIQVRSSDTAVARVIATATIAAGSRQATFTVTTLRRTTRALCRIYVQLGASTKSIQLNVTP